MDMELCYRRTMYRRCPLREQDHMLICKVRMLDILSLHPTLYPLLQFLKHSTESCPSCTESV